MVHSRTVEKLTQASKYERSEERQGYRSGHYSRNLTTTSGDVTLNVPRLKGISFETAIIERYRRRESSVEEALIEMYLAGRIRSARGGYHRSALGQQGVAFPPSAS
jgi:transposase-like protein